MTEDFSFRNLLKPGQAMEMALRRELQRRKTLWVPRDGYVYRGAGDYLLQHGQFFVGGPVPDEFAHLKGELGMCFANSIEAVARDKRLRYFEGVYSVAGAFTPHAWCVDDQDRIVDLTFDAEWEGCGDTEHRPIMRADHWGYMGVQFHPEYIEEHHAVIGWGCFDRPDTDRRTGRLIGQDLESWPELPTLKVRYDPDRRNLP
jgi:hypothetical protein